MTCLVAVTMLVSVDGSLADRRTDRGKFLLSQNCEQCHAVGRDGQSPLAAAPPFRRIGERMGQDELLQRLREGLSSAHRDMPTFRFSRPDALAIRAYLNSIQQ